MNKLCVRIFSKRLDKTIFKYYTIIKKSEKNVKKKNCKCRRNIKIIVKKKIIDKSALTVQKMSDLSRWKSFKLLYD